MIAYKAIIRNREIRLQIIRRLSWIPDKLYLKLVFRIKTGKKLNLEPPVGFNEKINWLKLNRVHPEYSKLADKIEVRSYIKQKLGDEYLFPLLGVWDSFDQIDFDKLPDAFVLKCSHDSGSVKIIQEKTKTNKYLLKSFFDKRMRLNSFWIGREYPYKNIIPHILAEKLMVSDIPGGSINDYKFFCFNGIPRIMFVATDRNIDCKFDFFDMDFNHLDIVNIHPQAGRNIEKPKYFDEMKKIARILSNDIPFVRIDLYEINGQIYFGEFTFFHGGGFYLFYPEKWEKKLGDMLLID